MLESQHKAILLLDPDDFGAIVCFGLYPILIVDVLEDLIEAGDHFHRIVDKLEIELAICSQQMPAVYFEQNAFWDFKVLVALDIDHLVAVNGLIVLSVIH